MPALRFEDIGGLVGDTAGTVDRATRQVASTKRGRDRDALQTFIIECDPSGGGLTGTLHLQASVDSPPITRSRQDPFPPLGEDLLWSDLVTLVFTAETGTIFLQLEVESAQHRFIFKAQAGLSGRILRIQTMI